MKRLLAFFWESRTFEKKECIFIKKFRDKKPRFYLITGVQYEN